MKGKDIMTATYKYADLAKAYDNFLTPVVKIYAQGLEVDVVKQGAAIEGIQITLSIDEASALSFQITNAFDPESHQMKSGIVSVFSVGTILEAEIGYGSNLTKIFKGYVAEYRTSYQDVPVISITAVDLRRLMKKNQRKDYTFKEKTCSRIFEKLIGNYSSLYGNLHVDSDTSEVQLIQNGTDYDFVTNKLCRMAERDFFMVGTDVYFQKRTASKSAFLELEWGSSLLSFEKGTQYCNETLIAYSDQKDKTGKMEELQVKTADSTPSLLSEPLKEEWKLQEGLDSDTLKKWLKKRENEKKSESQTANGTVIGLPEIVPGRYIQISKIASADAGLFYIKEVKHNFGNDGFTTSFTVGNQLDKWDAQKSAIDTGQIKAKGITRAVVKENWDKDHQGCVKVEFLTGEEGKKTTKWLPVAQSYCGNGFGIYFLPEIDTEVILGSQQDDVNSMVVMGALWNKADQIPKETAVEKNTIKRICTKGKHEILFDDDADKGKLSIHTSKNLQITMSEKEKTISVSDADGKNVLLIDGENGSIQIKAEKKISLSAGGKDMIILDGNGKKLTLQAEHVEEKGTQDLKIQTQNLSVKGEITELKAGGSFKINSSGIAEIKGTMVKIN